MRISDVQTFIVETGIRRWIFVKVETDDGLAGYGECYDRASPHGVIATIEDLKPLLIGKDPRAYEVRFWDMIQATRQSPGGITAKAIAGIELALLDLKAKALGISVVELFGGPTRDKVRVYWSHCGSYRARRPDILGTPPVRNMRDVAELGREVVARGYTALKTGPSLVFEPASENTDGVASTSLLRHIETLTGTFRDAVGPEVDIALDLVFDFKQEGCMRIAKVLEPFNLLWLELDMFDPEAILQIKQSTTTKFCTGESLFSMRDYIPYFALHAADIFMVDVPWNGFSQAKKIGDLAEVYQLNVAPHNCYSHLASFISASLCAVLPSVRIMEMEVDDVPWKDDLVTTTLEVIDGYMTIPTGPGWGTDLNEEALREHLWDPVGTYR